MRWSICCHRVPVVACNDDADAGTSPVAAARLPTAIAAARAVQDDARLLVEEVVDGRKHRP